jgi:hypothetical protein
MNYYEDRDHEAGCATEAQNCYAEAEMGFREVAFKAKAEIQQHLAQGLFVLTGSHDYYCQSTDAVVGIIEGLVSVHATREEAEAQLETLYNSNPYIYGSEVSLNILPR